MTTAALALDSEILALELLDLLRDLEPSHWRDELEEAFRQRVSEIEQRLEPLLQLPIADERLIALREGLDRLAEVLAKHAPATELPADLLRQEWMDFRLRLQGSYETIASNLRAYEIHIPALRPTNYLRNLFHAGMSMFAVGVIAVLPHPRLLLLISGAVAVFAWFLETSRRFSSFMDQGTWWFFGPMAHPHERTQVNSATWFSTALLALALTGSPLLGAVALAVLGLADPAAAIVGRRWGCLRLVNGRTLEGSLTFLAVGTVAAYGAVVLFRPDMQLGAALAIAAGAAGLGALAELSARRIDDNLLVPLGAAAGAALVAQLCGVPF